MNLIQVKLIGNDNRLSSAGYTYDQESTIYDDNLQDVIKNTRWYLDNLDYLREYRVSWKTYRNKIPTLPTKYVEKR